MALICIKPAPRRPRSSPSPRAAVAAVLDGQLAAVSSLSPQRPRGARLGPSPGRVVSPTKAELADVAPGTHPSDTAGKPRFSHPQPPTS